MKNTALVIATVLLPLMSWQSADTQSTRSVNKREISWNEFQQLLADDELVMDLESTAVARKSMNNRASVVYKQLTGDTAYLQLSPVSPVLKFASLIRLQYAVMHMRRHTSGRKHTFHDYLADSTRTFRTTEESIAVLAVRLQLEPAALDLSPESIVPIQAALQRLMPERTNLIKEEKQLIYALSDYVGDIVYRQRGGWKYSTDRRGETILPESVSVANEAFPVDWFRQYIRILLNREYGKLADLIRRSTSGTNR